MGTVHINPLVAGSDHAAWQIIDSRTLDADASSISFTGLDGDQAVRYKLLCTSVTAGTITSPSIQLNGDVGANYNYLTAALAATYAGSSQANRTSFSSGIGAGAGSVVMIEFEIMASAGVKTIRAVTSTTTTGSASQVVITTGDWTGTAKVTQIDLIAAGVGGEFVAGGTFDLLALGPR